MDLAHELLRFITAERREPPPTPGTEPVATERREEPVSPEQEGDPSSSGTSSAEVLKQVEREASDCTKCELSENRNKVVFGEGTVEASVMIIGEGPGAQEDKEGLPFVGRAGQLLRKGLRKVGLGEEEVYITNTVKCRPPNNRGPKQDELESCRPYLDRQVELIDPDVVISLGNFALRYCLDGDRRISNCRGNLYDWNECTLVPAYHPAYILRNQSEAQNFIDDLKLAADQIT